MDRQTSPDQLTAQQSSAGVATSVATNPKRDSTLVRIANPNDDSGIRKLLRDNPMRGTLSVALTREPSYFDAGKIEGDDHRALVALDNDRVIGVGSMSSRMRYINGDSMRIGYLGGLRLDASVRGQFSIVRRGYRLFRELHEQGGPPIYLTSIIEDNIDARRVLERGLPGMPRYRHVDDFVTLMIAARGAAGNHPNVHEVNSEEAGAFADRFNRAYQFAPAGLVPVEPLAMVRDGQIAGVAALWDQRSVKQIVVCDYARPLKWLRPAINVLSLMRGTPRLPKVGHALSQAFISHLAADSDVMLYLIRSIAHRAVGRGIEYLTLGFSARDPRCAMVRSAFRCRAYRSRLYVVYWPDGRALAESLDARYAQPEVALL